MISQRSRDSLAAWMKKNGDNLLLNAVRADVSAVTKTLENSEHPVTACFLCLLF